LPSPLQSGYAEAQSWSLRPARPDGFSAERLLGDNSMADLKIDLRKELLGRVKREFIETLERDEQAAVEAATGEMGNKPDAVKLGWLRMRTKESWTKQRYTVTVGRAFEKLRKMVEAHEAAGPADKS